MKKKIGISIFLMLILGTYFLFSPTEEKVEKQVQQKNVEINKVSHVENSKIIEVEEDDPDELEEVDDEVEDEVVSDLSLPDECLIDVNRIPLDEIKHTEKVSSFFSESCLEKFLKLFGGDREYLDFAIGACDIDEGFKIVQDFEVFNKIVAGEFKAEDYEEGFEALKEKAGKSFIPSYNEFRTNCKDSFNDNFKSYVSYLVKHKDEIESASTYFMEELINEVGIGGIQSEIGLGIKDATQDYPLLRKAGDQFFKLLTPRLRSLSNKFVRQAILHQFSEGNINSDTSFSEVLKSINLKNTY